MAGDSSVGKTSFVIRLCHQKFIPSVSATLGIDFYSINLMVNQESVVIQIWDTAGQERFKGLTKSYFRQADCIFLMYDVTSERSFLSIQSWMDSIRENTAKSTVIMICANKIDLMDSSKNCVGYNDGRRLAGDSGAMFTEVSVKSGENVLESIIEIGE